MSISSPLPNTSTLAILISPRKSPQIAKNGVPKMNFPELPGPRVSVEILQEPIQENIPGELFMYWFRARGGNLTPAPNRVVEDEGGGRDCCSERKRRMTSRNHGASGMGKPGLRTPRKREGTLS